ELTVGETATLPNWSRVTVNSVPETTASEEDPVASSGQHYLVEVEYCAAEEDGAVDPAHGGMHRGVPAASAHVHEAVEDPLEARELTVGQCATGNVGFYTIDDEPSDLKVDFRPGDLGSLTWAVEDDE